MYVLTDNFRNDMNHRLFAVAFIKLNSRTKCTHSICSYGLHQTVKTNPMKFGDSAGADAADWSGADVEAAEWSGVDIESVDWSVLPSQV